MTTSTHAMPAQPAEPVRESGRWLIWTAGLVVAVGAAVATAHGLYRVALAATVPGPIAWLYPLITDGLALVAYASTTRLSAGGRRYAWAVVVLAAGLSGLAQASYLAIGVATAPTQLRFGVGAWPAVAAAITAHLLYLLAAHPAVQRPTVGQQPVGRLDSAVQPEVGQRPAVRPTVGRLDGTVRPVVSNRASRAQSHDGVGRLDTVGQPADVEPPSVAGHGSGAGVPDTGGPGRDGDLSGLSVPTSPAGSLRRQAPPTGSPTVPPSDGVQPGAVQLVQPAVVQPDPLRPDVVQPVQPDSVVQPDVGQPGPARQTPAPAPVGHPVTQPVGQQPGPVGQADAETPIERARAAALVHRDEHGALPSVSQLAGLAAVARGTAATALKQLRDQPDDRRHGLQLIHDEHTGTSR